MPRCRTNRALTALLCALGCAAAGCSRGPDSDEAIDACRDGRVEEGFALIKEIARVRSPATLQADAVTFCLDAALAAADEQGAWASLANQVAVVDDVVETLASPSLWRSYTGARAAVAYARTTGELCCMHDGIEAFDALLDDPSSPAGDDRDGLVDPWYRRARGELLDAGEWLIEVDDRMVFAPSLSDVLPAEPADAYRDRLGQAVTLHNVLLQAETDDSPPLRSGAPLGVPVDGIEATAFRTVLVRRGGELSGRPLAARWDDRWDALLARLQPGVLHTCSGRIAEAGAPAGPQGIVLLETCGEEAARTRQLFRQRRCTVCGVRDERQVCHDGFGRTDPQAAAEAREAVCDELLMFHEFPASCGSVVQMTRSCRPNDEEADDVPGGESGAATAAD